MRKTSENKIKAAETMKQCWNREIPRDVVSSNVQHKLETIVTSMSGFFSLNFEIFLCMPSALMFAINGMKLACLCYRSSNTVILCTFSAPFNCLQNKNYRVDCNEI